MSAGFAKRPGDERPRFVPRYGAPLVAVVAVQEVWSAFARLDLHNQLEQLANRERHPHCSRALHPHVNREPLARQWSHSPWRVRRLTRVEERLDDDFHGLGRSQPTARASRDWVAHQNERSPTDSCAPVRGLQRLVSRHARPSCAQASARQAPSSHTRGKGSEHFAVPPALRAWTACSPGVGPC